MPWSRRRAHARTYDGSMKEIDAAVERLRAKGARRIVVAGQSMGANAALGYGARREGLAGIILLAPGLVPGMRGFQARVASGMAKARKLASQGKGDVRTSFVDINQGRTKNISTTARIYLSWFAPDGPAVWTSNAAKLKGGVPVFCAEGTREPYPRCAYATSRLPKGTRRKIVTVNAGHMGVPRAARRHVLAWLRALTD